MMFWEQISGHLCPNMTDSRPPYEDGEKPIVRIQNPSTYNAGGNSYDFIFVIDTCKNLQGLTNATCKEEDES
jgi:hypothetical protein